jgi:hypothetical protein
MAHTSSLIERCCGFEGRENKMSRRSEKEPAPHVFNNEFFPSLSVKRSCSWKSQNQCHCHMPSMRHNSRYAVPAVITFFLTIMNNSTSQDRSEAPLRPIFSPEAAGPASLIQVIQSKHQPGVLDRQDAYDCE